MDVLFAILAGALLVGAVWLSVARLQWELRIKAEDDLNDFWDEMSRSRSERHWQ